MAAALGKLEQIEADIVKVRSELEATEARRAELLIEESPDLDILGNLGVRVNALSARLEHLAGRLLIAQGELQTLTMSVGGQSEALWRMTRQRLIDRVAGQMLELIHPDLRMLRAQQVAGVAPFGREVIEAERTLAIELHPMVSNPLCDNEVRKWSEERKMTLGIICQQADQILGRLPKLLETTVGLETAAPLQSTQQEAA